MLIYFLIGAALGVGTGVPPGPVNLAVINAAYRSTLRRALATGFGGMLGDATYAALGIFGVGPAIQRHPAVPPILYLATGLALVVYGLINVRRQPTPLPVATRNGDGNGDRNAGPDSRPILGGLGTGLALLSLNPSALLTWVVIVGSFMADASRAEGIAAVLGVGCGSFGWFCVVATATVYGKRMMGEKTAFIPRLVGGLLVAYGVFSVGRALHYWVG